ncbi:MAG: hypothetical protein ACE5GX_17850 [Thermoanaerobaculia bacterium]
MTRHWNLDQRLDEWGGLGAWRHLASVVSIALAALVRWHYCLLGEPLIDETTYLGAFRALAEGLSPYDVPGYHYTPFFAWSGGAIWSQWGEVGALAALRSTSLIGLAVAVWCATAWLAASWLGRLAAAVAYVALAPAVHAGFCMGNISFSVLGLILPGLIFWSRPRLATGAIPSGLALGASVATKPIAPLALVSLVCHRPAPGSAGACSRRHWVAGILGGVTALALLGPMIPKIGEMTDQPIEALAYSRSFSLTRILDLIGIELTPPVVVLIGAVALVLLLRLGPLDRSRLVAVAVTASVLATPIVWNHTLVLTLPLQVMALSLALVRWRERTRGDRKRAYEYCFVVLGALAIQFCEGFGAVDTFPPVPQAAFLSVPYVAPAALLAYLLVLGSDRRRR